MSHSKKTEKSEGDSSPLIVAVSSRALFDLEKEHEIFKERGEDAYIKEQHARRNIVAAPGVAFPLVKKLLSFNKDGEERVRLVVISRNDPVTGLRVFRAIADNHLNISIGCFTRGAPSFPYLQPFGANLFLSALAEDVQEALNHGVPAAHVRGGNNDDASSKNDDVLRIAFDGDAVLFGDESERVFQEQGLPAFQKEEEELSKHPLSAGPFKPFIDKLSTLQKQLKDESGRIRTALITARGAPAHERPIRTLMDWGINIDEAFFMSGNDKQDIIRRFGADFYFDDQVKNVRDISGGGHVISGVINQKK